MDKQEILKRVGKYADRKDFDFEYFNIQSKDQNNSDIAIVADWNSDKITKHFYWKLERIFDLYFYDEYTTCSECGNLINTRPHSYMWEENSILQEYEIFCLDCIHDAELFEDCLEFYLDNPKRTLRSFCADWLIELGFEKINPESFQNGLHKHMNDNPESILKNKLWNITEAESQNEYEYVFCLDDVSQFYIEFSLYRRIKE